MNHVHGLSVDEVSTLTHFTTAMVELMATFRESWMRADETNAHAIEVALAVLFSESHSVKRNVTLCRKVLSYSNDRAEELITNISCRLMDLGAMEHRLERIAQDAAQLQRTIDTSDRALVGLRPIGERIEASAGACLLIFRETSTAAQLDSVAKVIDLRRGG